MRGEVHGSCHGGDRDDAAAIGGHEEVAALAVRACVAPLDLDVDGSLAWLDFGLDRAAHLRAQPSVIRVLEAHGGCFVDAHFHTIDADFRLA